MPKYIALRDCYDRDRYHYEGKTYEIPDGVKVHPKNFKLVDNPILVTDNASPSVMVEIPSVPEQVTEPPKKQYVCSVCGKVVRTALALSGHSRSHKEKK